MQQHTRFQFKKYYMRGGQGPSWRGIHRIEVVGQANIGLCHLTFAQQCKHSSRITPTKNTNYRYATNLRSLGDVHSQSPHHTHTIHRNLSNPEPSPIVKTWQRCDYHRPCIKPIKTYISGFGALRLFVRWYFTLAPCAQRHTDQQAPPHLAESSESLQLSEG